MLNKFTRVCRDFLSLFLFLLGLYQTELQAGMDLKVVHGEVAIKEDSDTIHIEASNHSILECEGPLVAEGKTIHFSLPDPTSSILIRFTGEVPSDVYGQVVSNGNLYFAAPSGLNLHSESSILSAGCFPSTIDVDDETFASNGSLQFVGNSNAPLTHEGIIKCGKITFMSKRISIGERALLDASGDFKGGDIYIGGGWAGKDPSIPNAHVVRVDKGARIIADAKIEGDGGDVVFWADQRNTFLGDISSRGAGTSGKGGNSEVSSKGQLYFDGTASLSSPNGSQGTFLLDPASITIQASNPDIDGLNQGHDIVTANELASPLTFPGVSSVITSGAVSALLTGGVTMTLSADNFITVNSPITAAGPVTSFILNAPIVNLNEPITLPFGGTLAGNATVVNVGVSGLIQNGADAVATGGTINLAATTYAHEQVNILLGKNLTLNGAGINSTIIQSPNTAQLTNSFNYTGPSARTFTPVIMAQYAASVTIQNLTVDGNNQGDTNLAPHFTGIGFHDTSGTISNVHVINIQDRGYPIGYQEGSAIVAATDIGTNNVTIQNCTVDHFQKQAILTIGPLLIVNVDGNNVVGNVPPSPANANGIELFDGATGTIANNTVTQVNSVSDATGILVFNADNLFVTGNTNNSNDVGIYCIDCGAVLTIDNNTCNNNTDTGIVVDNSSLSMPVTSILRNNTMSGNVNAAMQLVSSVNQPYFLSNNTFSIGSTNGLIVTGASFNGPEVSMSNDTFTSSTTPPGYYIEMDACGNNIWPTTASVSFDGLISGQITPAQFNTLLLKIFDKHNNPSLGLVLDYIPPAPPTVTALSPSFGTFVGGTIVTITGTNFIRGATVNFGPNPATNVTILSATTIQATAPAHAAGIVEVQVTTGNGTSALNPPFDQYTYVGAPPPPPTVTAVNPNIGPEFGGTTVTVTGTGFLSGPTTVSFGAAPATNVIVISDTLLTAVSPVGSGVVDVVVTTINGSSTITPADKFTYQVPLIPPVVTALSPSFGPSVGGNTVTITGVGFISGDTTVFFGSAPATDIHILSNTSMTVTAPPGLNLVNVVVRTPLGESLTTISSQYIYNPLPAAPLNFIGVSKRNKFLNVTTYKLITTWDPSPSPVIFYRIYENGRVIKEVAADAPLTFTICLKSKNPSDVFQLTSVNADLVESAPATLRIVNE